MLRGRPTARTHPRARVLVAVMCVAAVLGAPPVATQAATADYPGMERFALSLVNCTRTGGWVRRDGSCKGRGSGDHSAYRKPLTMHNGIRPDVARPYARRLANAGYLTHSLGGGSIRSRLRAAGYRGTPYGESLGRSGGVSVRKMVIQTHRMMQSERSWNGWHWRNMKNRDFKRVGVGIAKAGGQSYVVYDFYG